MKTVIKIALALMVIVGCVNVGRALMNEYYFEDTVHQALLFDPRMTDTEIVDAVMKAAESYGIEMEPKDIDINQVGPDVRVDMSYTTDIVVIPGLFSQPWTFTPSASTRVLVGNRRKPS
jgi:hypothetical protein